MHRAKLPYTVTEIYFPCGFAKKRYEARIENKTGDAGGRKWINTHHQRYVTGLQNSALHDWQHQKMSCLIFSLKLPSPQNTTTPEYAATSTSPALLTMCWGSGENFNTWRITFPHISLSEPCWTLIKREMKWLPSFHTEFLRCSCNYYLYYSGAHDEQMFADKCEESCPATDSGWLNYMTSRLVSFSVHGSKHCNLQIN